MDIDAALDDFYSEITEPKTEDVKSNNVISQPSEDCTEITSKTRRRFQISLKSLGSKFSHFYVVFLQKLLNQQKNMLFQKLYV